MSAPATASPDREALRGPRALVAFSDLREPLAIFCLVRGALFVLAYAATYLFPVAGHATRIWASGGFLDAWTRWDAGWYLLIAERGYTYDPSDPVSGVAFFPLYPLLMRAVAPLAGGTVAAGLLVANAAYALALCVLYQLATLRFDRDVARRSVVLLACFPYSFFLGAIYTEALFLLLAVAAFWLAERRQWWLAGLAAGLCSATRLVGATLGPALGLLYLEQKGYRPRAIGRDALPLGLTPLGLVAFMGYQYLAFGEPLAMVRSSTSWGRYNPFVEGFGRFSPLALGPGNFDLVLALNLAAALLWLLAVVPLWRLLGPAYAAFVLLSTLIPLSQQTESLGRFMAVLFPVFILVAYHARQRLLFSLILYASTLLLALLTILFADGYWVM